MSHPPPTVVLDDGTLHDESVNVIRTHLVTDGYAYITGFRDDFDYLSALNLFGQQQPQYNSQLVRDITPDPNMSNDVISALNTAELAPHTEMFEAPGLPPRHVALWCAHPADGPGGETTLADMRDILTQFTAAEQEHLRDTSYQWRSRPTLANEGIHMRAEHPVIERTDYGTVRRFSALDINQTDGLIARYINTGPTHFTEHHVPVRIERNALLIWNNWRIMHARNAFSDPRRHLRRVLLGPAPS